MTIRLEDVVEWIRRANDLIQENKEYLTQLDQAIGDGDHGVNMSRGFAEVLKKMSATSYQDIGAVFQDVGMTLLSKVGGASGPLFGTAFIKAAGSLKGKQEMTIEDFSQALQEAVGGIKLRGKAQIGEKTMLDVWEPVVSYIAEQGNETLWDHVKELSHEQMEKTKSLEAKKGRASFLGSRSIGHLDPGSVSSYYLFATLCMTLEKGEVKP
ncbi:dihydroxyacetone kinase subunit DhaL [Brevibacillus ginsengisoli]|uniref:dihydroxyacetone kinase subunit DhaL n=1 Tax=Brevibacillus ginsengisoli TaxID=363854 RepID=UPI003CF0ADC9